MIYKILSLSNQSPVEDLKKFLSGFFSNPTSKVYNWKTYKVQLEALLSAIKIEHLPKDAQELIKENRPGFHVVPIAEVDFKLPSGAPYFVKINIYIANSPDGRVVMVPPHHHIEHKSPLFSGLPQAATYPAYASEGAKPAEQIYKTVRLKDGRKAVVFEQEHDRLKTPFNYGPVHSLSVKDGSGAFFAVYVLDNTNRGLGPDSQYFPELIQTKERLEQVAHLIEEKRLTPFNGSKSELISAPFIVDEHLHTEENKLLIETIKSVTVEAYQRKALDNRFVIKPGVTWPQIERWLNQHSLLTDFNRASVESSLKPLLQKVNNGELEKVILAPKKSTISCLESVLYRVHPDEKTVTTPLSNEVKVRVTQKDGHINVFIGPGSHEVNPEHVLGSVPFDLSSIGCASLATNPHNLLTALAQQGRKATIHIHPGLKALPFVTNNAGDNGISVTAVSSTGTSSHPYFDILSQNPSLFTVEESSHPFDLLTTKPLSQRPLPKQKPKKELSEIQRLRADILREDTEKIEKILGKFDTVRSILSEINFGELRVPLTSRKTGEFASKLLEGVSAQTVRIKKFNPEGKGWSDDSLQKKQKSYEFSLGKLERIIKEKVLEKLDEAIKALLIEFSGNRELLQTLEKLDYKKFIRLFEGLEKQFSTR